MKYKIVPQIKAKGWPVTGEGYKEAHQVAKGHEIKKFGAKRFKSLENVIEKKIPSGELAGSHTKTGKIIISEKIPEKYHEQIAEHERFEHRRMKRRIKTRRTKRR